MRSGAEAPSLELQLSQRRRRSPPRSSAEALSPTSSRRVVDGPETIEPARSVPCRTWGNAGASPADPTGTRRAPLVGPARAVPPRSGVGYRPEHVVMPEHPSCSIAAVVLPSRRSTPRRQARPYTWVLLVGDRSRVPEHLRLDFRSSPLGPSPPSAPERGLETLARALASHEAPRRSTTTASTRRTTRSRHRGDTREHRHEDVAARSRLGVPGYSSALRVGPSAALASADTEVSALATSQSEPCRAAPPARTQVAGPCMGTSLPHRFWTAPERRPSTFGHAIRENSLQTRPGSDTVLPEPDALHAVHQDSRSSRGPREGSA